MTRRTRRDRDRELIAASPMPWSLAVCANGWFHVRAVLDGERGKRIAEAAARELNRIARERRGKGSAK